MQKEKKKIIIVTVLITMVITIALTLGSLYFVKRWGINQYEKAKEQSGIQSIEETNYNIPNFSINLTGFYKMNINQDNLANIKKYKVKVRFIKDYKVYDESFIGVRVTDVFDSLDIKNYESATFQCKAGLMVKYIKKDMNENKFLAFNIDDKDLTENELVALISPDMDTSYSIPNVTEIYFQ